MLRCRSTRTAATFALGICLGLAQPAGAQDFERNILTGGPSGTYIQIGRDIANLGADCSAPLNVRESAGSLENFLGVRERRHTQFGIVQSDVLDFVRSFRQNDAAAQRAVAGVRLAFPLYNEEVHILARKGLATVEDLAGARVGVGRQDSGTFITASLILARLGIDVGERRTVGAGDALEALIEGDLDAFFYVAGVPTKLFADGRITAAQFHLLPIQSSRLPDPYTASTIAAGSYPFQTEPVEVAAVRAALMTFEYQPRRNAYHRQACRAVSDVAHLVFKNIDYLKNVGHPKWKEVDLFAAPAGWDVSACVLAGLDESYELECEAQPLSCDRDDLSPNEVYRCRLCERFGGDDC